MCCLSCTLPLLCITACCLFPWSMWSAHTHFAHSMPPHCCLSHSLSCCSSGGSSALSATIKEGDRNVLKLKFARSRNNGGSEQPGRTQQEEQLTEYQRSRPQRQVGFTGFSVGSIGSKQVLLGMHYTLLVQSVGAARQRGCTQLYVLGALCML